MTEIFQPLTRLYRALVSPPNTPAKKEDALRFGLLGASQIAPISIIAPAKSHAEVIIAAVAARDRKKADAYAKKHNIPIVHSSYEDLLADPSINCIYIALPNGLHYEWALRSLRAGKHVLLEKPSCSNSTEAHSLFQHAAATSANSPVLLEALHYRFHPAWQAFLATLHASPSAGPVQRALSQQFLCRGLLPRDDIRFNYSLAGGALMDFGVYNLSCLRQVFAAEPEAVVSATYRAPRAARKGEESLEAVDEAVVATYRVPAGGVGELRADMASAGGWPAFLPEWMTRSVPSLGYPKTVVELGEKVVVEEEGGKVGETHVVKRTVTMWNHLMPFIWHRIDVQDVHSLRRTSDGAVLRTWTVDEQIKAYTWPEEEGEGKIGEEWWTTYRHQLEQFVNKVKGRKVGVWVSLEDSLKQMEAIDMTYTKLGLPLRPTSEFSL